MEGVDLLFFMAIVMLKKKVFIRNFIWFDFIINVVKYFKAAKVFLGLMLCYKKK